MDISVTDRTQPFPGLAQHLVATSELEISVKQLIFENQSLHIKVWANNKFQENSQQFQLQKKHISFTLTKEVTTETLPSCWVKFLTEKYPQKILNISGYQ